MSEPYYREYFAGDAQGYAPARAIYGDADGPQGATTYEGRFSNHHSKNTPVYAKTVTAAGLTVDLPSPDSGIGTDAITPRDQNNIQQVIDKEPFCFFVEIIIFVLKHDSANTLFSSLFFHIFFSLLRVSFLLLTFYYETQIFD